MADNTKAKKSTGKKSAKKTAGKNSSSKAQSKKDKNGKLGFYENYRTILAFVYILIAVLFVCLEFIKGVNLWAKLRGSLFAFLGLGVYVFTVCIFVLGLRMALDRLKRNVAVSTVAAFTLSAAFSSLIHVFQNLGSSDDPLSQQLKYVAQAGWTVSENGIKPTGGIVGALIGGGLRLAMGNGVFVVLIVLLLVSIMFYSDIRFTSVANSFSSAVNDGKERLDVSADNMKTRHAERQEERQERRRIQLEQKVEQERLRRQDEQLKAAKAQSGFSPDIYNLNLSPSAQKEKKPSPQQVTDDDGIFTKYTSRSDKRSKTKSPAASFTFITDEDKQEGRKILHSDFDNEKNTQTTEVSVEPEQAQPSDSVNTEMDVANLDSDLQQTHNEFEIDNKKEDDIIKAAVTNANANAEKNRSEVAQYSDDEQPKHEYSFPPIDCLTQPDFSREEDYATEMKTTSKKLVDTLKSFGVETNLIGISRGPSVTRYELQPAPGVKISRISSLSDDIALNLASSGVRIEAPIPNKSAVGIEVPNQIRSTVTLREIISSSEFKKSDSKLNVALGKDITGGVTCADLAKMPHLLIAGTTGSGKSVCLNCMIVSILYNATPDQVKLLMIDPKQVEFSVYNGIPHLLVPVISDVRKAAGSLAWAVAEMENRYKTFSTCGVRDISGYNRYVLSHPDLNLMPQIVIFIDELNDLMMVSPKEVEDSICRLAQKARAAGMHLVVATQRPSVNVITGIIKANIPSRISLSVSSQVDSRTILDAIGAEKLLGNGDMLYNPVGVSKPVRIQGAYVSDGEIEKIVNFIKDQTQVEYDNDVMDEIERNAVMDKKQTVAVAADEAGEEDGMLFKALQIAVECGAVSTSLLQRKLRIGYARAARIMDQIDEHGWVGPAETASKPRKTLITKAQLLEMQAMSGTINDNDSENDDFDILSD